MTTTDVTVLDMATLEDRLAAEALALVQDIRFDRAAAHRAVHAMDRLQLEQVACVLAAMVDPNVRFNVLAWWRVEHGTAEVAA